MSANRPTPDFDDELLSAYVDNELTPEERAAVDERLRTDERARQLLADLRRTSEAVRSLPRVTLGRDLSASVLASIEQRAPKVERATVLEMPQRSRGKGLGWVVLAVAAALMLMVFRPGGDGPREDAQVAQSSEEKSEQQDRQAAIESDKDKLGVATAAPDSEAAQARRDASKLQDRATAEPNESSADSRVASAPLARGGVVTGAAEPAPSGSARVEPVAPNATPTPNIRVVEVTLPPGTEGDWFGALLANTGIVLNDAPAETTAAGLEVLPRNRQEWAGAELVLVEATPAALAALDAQLNAASAAADAIAEPPATTEGELRADGDAAEEAVRSRGVQTLGRAWRFSDAVASNASELDDAIAARSMERSGAAPAGADTTNGRGGGALGGGGPAGAGGGAFGGGPAGAGGGGPRDNRAASAGAAREVAQPREQVLFVIRRAEN